MISAERQILLAIAAGCTLKSHRSLDGEKVFRLHPLDTPAQDLEQTIVESLRRQGLIDSNKKFPAATYLLTEKGRQAVTGLGEDPDDLPLTARRWGNEE